METKISNTKVELNLKELNPLLQALENSLSESKRQQESYLNRLESIIKDANFYPKWAIISFFIMVLIFFLSLFYAYTVKTNAIEMEKVAYENGKTAATDYINLYLSENPKALEQYKKWAETK